MGGTTAAAWTDNNTINECQAFSPKLWRMNWPAQFRLGSIKKYNRNINLIEFLQIYTTVIQAADEDEKVVENYLQTALEGLTRT